jgi:DNA-binding response OmpR family regulator
LIEADGEPLDDKTLASRIAPDADLAARSAHVAAWRLRKKLALVFGEDVIEPVRARGYVLSRKVEMIDAVRAKWD